MKKKLSPVIGLEVHVELATKSKMFCGCPADHFGKKPNTQTCPVCLALPGALPVPNQKAIDWTILLGLALDCKIANTSKFDRKHYFYPDLPKGYQISQYDQPLCYQGFLETSEGPVRITRAHLEEDTGKLKHTQIDTKPVSLVDFNRSGVPLVEIVTEPDIKSAKHAKEFTKRLTQIIRMLGISTADMEKGSMRLEANVSWGLDLGYKVELKNINSYNYLAKAIDYELKRQKKLLDKGQTPVQETRGYNEKKGVTFSQRVKEGAADYRYFPDPDIPPMKFDPKYISKIKSQLPELPSQVKKRWAKSYKINKQYLHVLLATPELIEFTDQALELAHKTKLDPNKIAGVIVNKKINPQKTQPKDLIKKLSNQKPKITDDKQIREWVKKAIQDNHKVVEQYKSGKVSVLQFFVGQVMKLSRGQADPDTTTKLLKQLLD